MREGQERRVQNCFLYFFALVFLCVKATLIIRFSENYEKFSCIMTLYLVILHPNIWGTGMFHLKVFFD